MGPVGVVVSNTTPLIALAWLEQLDLLPTLFESVTIPQAVHDELHRNPEKIGSAELSAAPWLRVTARMSQPLYFDILHQVGEWP